MLNLPDNFKADIQGQNLNLFPVVDIDGIFISTRNELGYEPLLLNIPSVKESLDFESRKLKISNVSLSVSNYEYNGKRFSDKISNFINRQAHIWWFSQSTDFDNLGDTAIKIYQGIIRRFTHDDTTCSIELEDRSQSTFHREVPIVRLGDDPDVLDKYKNKPYPMVYGSVDRSPCVLKMESAEDNVTRVVVADFKEIMLLSNCYLDLSGAYGEIPQTASSHGMGFGTYINGLEQFSIIDNECVFQNNISQRALVNQGLLQTILTVHPKDMFVAASSSEPNADINPHYIVGMDFTSNLNNMTTVASYGWFAARAGTTTGDWSSNGEYLGFNFGVSWSPNPIVLQGNLELPSPDIEKKYLTKTEFFIDGIHYLGLEDWTEDTFDEIWDWTVDDSDPKKFYVICSEKLIKEGQLTKYEYFQEHIINETFDITKGGEYGEIADFTFTLMNGHSFVNFNVLTIINYMKYIYTFINKNAFGKNFYANVKGRIQTDYLIETDNAYRYPDRQIKHIVKEELSFAGDAEHHSWEKEWFTDFTVSKKIDSKKLIEGIASNTPLIPRFKNNGTFGFTFLENDYDGSEVNADFGTIEVSDVISYKLSRTKIEEIKTRVKVLYKKDYATGEYLNNTGWIPVTDVFSQYDMGFYTLPTVGVEHPQSEYEFKADYIRHPTTAKLLRNFLLGWYCNQHNTMQLKLPLRYIGVEIGDIVQFDELIGGMKAYGEDYTQQIVRNGQWIYPYWMVMESSKSIDSVSLKVIQLHRLNQYPPTAPEAGDQTFQIAKGGSVSNNLDAEDLNIGDVLTYQELSQNGTGTFTLNSTTGAFTFAGDGVAGITTIDWRVTDDGGDSDEGLLTIEKLNRKPVVQNMDFEIEENTFTAITLTGTDADGDDFTLSVVDEPLNGVLTGTIPNLTYTPNADVFGYDSFTYKANDGTDDSDIATVTIRIISTNLAPLITDYFFEIEENAPTQTFVIDVYDVDMDISALVITSDPTLGTVEETLIISRIENPPNSSFSIIYTPNTDEHGEDIFTCEATDNESLTSNEAEIHVTISPPNIAPIPVILLNTHDAGYQEASYPVGNQDAGFADNHHFGGYIDLRQSHDANDDELIFTYNGITTEPAGITPNWDSYEFGSDFSVRANNGETNDWEAAQIDTPNSGFFSFYFEDGLSQAGIVTVNFTISDGVNDVLVAIPYQFHEGRMGDINNDGKINAFDVIRCVNFMLGNEEPTEAQFRAADVDTDGLINVLDVIAILHLVFDEEQDLYD